MKEKKLTWKHYTGIGLGILVVIYCIVAFYYSKSFVCGTEINGVDVSGLTVKEVVEIFDKKAETYNLTIKERKNQKEVLTKNQIQANFEGADDIQLIKDQQNSFMWIKGLLGGEKYNDVTMFSYNQNTFLKAYKRLNCFNEKKIIKIADAKPVYKDGKFIIQKEEEGTELKLTQTSKKVDEYIRDGINTIDLEKKKCYYNPEYTSKSKEIKDLTEKMNQAIKGSITYKFGKRTVVLDKNTYNKWMKIKKNKVEYTIDKNSMENWLLKFMYKYNTQYGWHKFKTHDGRVKKIYGGPYGWRISKDKEEAAIKKMLQNGTKETREPYWRSKGKVYDGINGDIGDTYVEVDISAQTVYYYKNGKQKFATSCVTGKMTADRKTPECVAYILYKDPSATLVGQGYSSDVKYWMPFIGNVGFHSAPWRSSFGGSEYISNGSHGCVNLPTYSASALYNMVEKGDPVVVYY
ncbi:L,D-transpeptidase family protein [Anaerostipes faecalis]|uniref:L,D-transpeptidase family protein n=1 Tax=Anaerostipes faecalis TaxID=2738446 RepID=UPI001C1DDAA3|nr:L,D-transpeptidase family protein [Anaerostipes faecalis]